jgi:hypothetical protein
VKEKGHENGSEDTGWQQYQADLAVLFLRAQDPGKVEDGGVLLPGLREW